jgi:hypothetical protein
MVDRRRPQLSARLRLSQEDRFRRDIVKASGKTEFVRIVKTRAGPPPQRAADRRSVVARPVAKHSVNINATMEIPFWSGARRAADRRRKALARRWLVHRICAHNSLSLGIHYRCLIKSFLTAIGESPLYQPAGPLRNISA